MSAYRDCIDKCYSGANAKTTPYYMDIRDENKVVSTGRKRAKREGGEITKI